MDFNFDFGKMFKTFNETFLDSKNVSITSNNGKNKIKINGKTITVTGNNVNVINGKIYVDGKLYKEQPDIEKETVVVQFTGQVGKVTIDSSVEIDGDIKANDITIKGPLNCNDVYGNIVASVVNCDDVYGKIKSNIINCDNYEEQ